MATEKGTIDTYLLIIITTIIIIIIIIIIIVMMMIIIIIIIIITDENTPGETISCSAIVLVFLVFARARITGCALGMWYKSSSLIRQFSVEV